MLFKSIRVKILAIYLFILVITLLLFSFVVYGSFVKTLYDDFDDLLSSRADGIVNSIDTYVRTKYAMAPEEDKASLTPPQLSEIDNFKLIARDWIEEKRKDPELMSIFVAILDAKGERVISSKAMPRIAAIPKDDFEDVLAGEDSFNTVKGDSITGKSTKFRVYTKPVFENGRITAIVQVAGPVELLLLASNSLILILFVLLPLTVLLAGVPGVLLFRLTLRPVDRIINTLLQITAENLKLRIHIPDTKDEVKRLADTFNDMLDRLDRSFSSQQRFIQNISHELRIPMNSLKSELDCALSKKCSEEEYKNLLVRSSKEIGEFSKTIENLLILSGFDNNQLSLEIRKIDLTRLVKQVLEEMEKPLEEKEIIASFSYKETIILDGDEKQLKRALINLVDNAVKYTNRKGKVKVALSKNGKYAEIAVKDTGIGIPKEEQDYIFDRFYQVTSSHRSRKGFGLGLSSARSIVADHKGMVNVDSEEGMGSTFTILLPLSYPG